MPISHVGVAVSDVDAAARFYAVALRPLGYRFIGRREAQVGFGVEEADFFLSPAGGAGLGMHVAFLAASFAQVQDVYAAAMGAGATSAGVPAYRGEKGQRYNAAVTDPEGNTVEVVYHIPSMEPPREETKQAYKPAKDAQQATPRAVDKGSPVKPKPRSAPTSHHSTHHDPRSPGHDHHAHHSAHEDDGPSKALVGTLIGAAASAAMVCAVLRDKPSSTSSGNRRSSRGSGNDRTRPLAIRTVYDIDDQKERVRPRGLPERVTPTSGGSRRDSLISNGKVRRRRSLEDERRGSESSKQGSRHSTVVDDERRRRSSTVDWRTKRERTPVGEDRRRASRASARDDDEDTATVLSAGWRGIPGGTVYPDDSISCVGTRRRSSAREWR